VNFLYFVAAFEQYVSPFMGKCSNEPAGCEARCAQTDASRNLRLILCFSASLNGVGWRSRTKGKRLRVKGLSQNTATYVIPAWF